MGLVDIHKYPLVRILIPLLGGIFIADNWSESLLPYRVFILLVLIGFSVGLLFLHIGVKAYTKRYYFGMVLVLFLIGLGVIRTLYTYPSDFFVVDERANGYTGVIIEEPVLRENGVEYLVCNHDPVSKVLLYVPMDTVSSEYMLGDEVAYIGRLNKPKEPTFAYNFNYRTYLERRGIKATAYLSSSDLTKLGDSDIGFWSKEMAIYRKALLERFKELGFEGDNLSIVAALTLGVKSELTSELKSAFSMAGVSHVLALSGLHIGLLYGVTYFLLAGILFHVRHKEIIALLGTISILWLFAFFVGGAASVVRSVLLFSLLGLSTLLNRRGSRLNSLAFVALIMLLYNPNWLFDVGFQLSFIAVTSILVFAPILQAKYRARTRVGKYVWTSFVISTVAQLGTAPFVIYYFSSFPVYFLLANLVVIPLVTILLYGLVLLVIMIKINYVAVVLAYLSKALASLLIAVVHFVSQLPYASIDGLSIYPYEMVLLGCLAVSFYYLLSSNKAIGVWLNLLIICIILINRVCLLSFNRPVDQVSLELVNGKLAIACYDQNSTVSVVLTDTFISERKIEYNHRKEWNYKHYKYAHYVKQYSSYDALFWDGSVLCFKGLSIAMLSKIDKVKQDHVAFHFDYLYLDKFSPIDIQQEIELYTPNAVIIHSFIQDDKKEVIKRLCEKNNVDYLTFNSKGCIDFLL